uniref:VASP tetramerisation domain-containing protein n=1 Tax=Panagrolaimus davidi TaxID=227884 RepID=A0A914Q1K5_9BILA
MWNVIVNFWPLCSRHWHSTGIPIIADKTLNENEITASTHSDAQLLTSNNQFADRVVSISNLKELTVLPKTAAAASANSELLQINEAKILILLLKIISILLFLIFISNIWFNIFSNRQQPQTIPSGPSASSLEELSELRKMVVSLESKFNTFLTGAKKEL